MFVVEDKVALITGAAKGIGLAYAKALLRHNLRAVSLIDIDITNGQKALEEIATEFGKNRSIFIIADVSNKSQLENAFERTVKTYNQLDIVINNAAIVQEIHWEKCISVNLVGTILGTTLAIKTYLPKYRSTEEAVVLNTSSVAGLMEYQTIPTYAATKHGIIGFSRSIGGSLHFKLSNVRVVTICPNGTDTAIVSPTADQVEEPFLSVINRSKKHTLFQSADDVGEHAISIIENARSGSVWIISNNIKSEVMFSKY